MNTSLACIVILSASLLFSPGDAKAAWNETNLASFKGTNGGGPEGGLIFDADGNLYGTTSQGGASGKGTVFKLTRPAAGKTAWTQTVLHTFSGADGIGPQGSLIFDRTGNLDGTTAQGGKSGDGTVFKLTPPAAGKTAWTQTVLLSFKGTDGADPSGGLVLDAAGNLYGAARAGGAVKCNPNNGLVGCGAIFKLSPPANGQTVWKETLLVSFNGTDGSSPNGGLIFDSTGNLDGTGGSNVPSIYGTVFKLSPPAAGKTVWTETVLFGFNGTNGKYPYDGLALDAKGNLYGTTEYGGTNSDGVVFELIRPKAGQTEWGETTLISFNGADGSTPLGGVIFDKAGDLCGATEYGGGSANGFGGNVFKLHPPKTGKTAWTETVLYTFTGAKAAAGGLFPAAGLTLNRTGNLFGTTFNGGTGHDGIVFQLAP